MKNTYAGALTLNTKNFAIEMDKKFAAAAANVFSAEYEKLQEVRRAYPNYKVVTVARKEKTSGTSGLTFEFTVNCCKNRMVWGNTKLLDTKQR